MFQNFITYTDVFRRKAILDELISDADMTEIISDMGIQIESRLRQDKGVLPDQVMNPEYLAKGVTITTAYTGTSKSRNSWNIVKRIVIEKTSCTVAGLVTLKLYGAYEDSLASYKLIKSIVLTSGVNTQTAVFPGNYNYYKFDITLESVTSGTPPVTVAGAINMTADVYLVENSFDEAILLLSIAQGFDTLQNYPDDAIKAEYEKYTKLFEAEFKNLSYSVDKTGDQIPDYEDGDFTSYERML